MVAGYTQLLASRYEGQLDEEADLFIRYTIEGVNRMQALIRDLLDYSRIQTHGRSFELVPLDGSLGWALANLEAAIDMSGASIVIDALPDVRADATQMGQLLQNLIGNAIKFRGERPLEIHVGAHRRGGEWQIFVRDNGLGIDPEARARVFDIFQRLHGRDDFDGTGIGLAICKRIVERHGGRIWNEPSPGQGTTFIFTLQRTRAAAQEGATSTDDGEPLPMAGAEPSLEGDPAVQDDEAAQTDEESSLATR